MTVVKFELNDATRRLSFVMDDCGGLDYVVSQAHEHGLARYEEPYPTLMAALVEARPGDMLDVGANTGLYALMAAGARPGIRVHAFEPLKSIADRLEVNLLLNEGLANQITVHRLALSDKGGVATFYETINPYGLITTSSGLDEAFSRQHGQMREHRVRTTTLDAWVAAQGIAEISFIKIDVEGHEQSVFSGAGETLARLRPILGVELLGGTDFGYFRKLLVEHCYLDGATAPDCLTFGQDPQFVGEGWNHLLIPKEHRDQVADLAMRIGLMVDGL